MNKWKCLWISWLDVLLTFLTCTASLCFEIIREPYTIVMGENGKAHLSGDRTVWVNSSGGHSKKMSAGSFFRKWVPMSSSPFMQPFEAWWLLLIFNHGGHGRYKSKVPVHHSNGTDCRPVLQQLSTTTLPNMIWHCRSQVISLDKVVHACKLKLLSFDYWFQSLCVRASVVGSIPSD